MAIYDDKANVAAKLEHYHGKLNNYLPEDSLKEIGLDGYTILESDSFSIPRGEYNLLGQSSDKSYAEPYIKAITVKDKAGNIYVHFYGTGDGNWRYNAVAYSDRPESSRMQDWALKYFDSTIKRHYGSEGGGGLYVSGHSQGGNMAQFVTLESTYGDIIEGCISLDGPGFSTAYVNGYVKRHGEDCYNRQRDKIWQYIGENDYVSALGQEHVYDKNHVRFLEYTGNGFDFAAFHAANGLVDENGNIRFTTNNDDSVLRKFILNSVQKINNLPADKQARAAELTMMICEDLLSGGEEVHSNMTKEDFEEFKELLGPLLIDILADTPELIVPVLREWEVNERLAQAIANLLEGINQLPYDERQKVINGILEAVAFENGQIQLDPHKVPAALVDAFPVLIETALTHPKDIMAILHEFNLDILVESAIIADPFAVVGFVFGCILVAYICDQEWFKSIIDAIEPLLDVIIDIVMNIAEMAIEIKEKVIELFNSLKEVISSVKEWFRNKFNAGVKYVANNPYFRVDTAKLRSYAQRIRSVNSRLQSLDSGMRGLYWQVGFLDLWDILCANLITSESPTLKKVISYLDNTAERLDDAERKVRGYVGE